MSWVLTLLIAARICFYMDVGGLKAIYVLLALSIPLSFLVHAFLGLFMSHPFELVSKK